ncbi:sigma-70 family RNA polymerase sigma factor [Mycolicibacterium sp. 018/SC-01/001]|uniref:RNA polymerase sigma factor n=1 Tax=Mycolicibacterium sp. 018/SC-01/001 TaxID=2592069 RepID=UPI00117EDA8E|nr:RNA polymerase sigma factor [Mycolicibacterium sp. 018/SC-01/001]TRW79865.1 sigma-70 family RNA polymerase sigma factor [Mycolicibacterium sp. 018/SC-01/001]
MTPRLDGDDDDQRAREQFVTETEAVRDILWRRASRLTFQRADAEDLVQETLLKGYAALNKYTTGTDLASWLLRIMVNTWVDKHRASVRRPSQYPTADITGLYVANAPVAASAEESALRRVPGDAEVAVRALPDDLREVVYYVCVVGYRNTELAALLDVPAGTVASRLHRARSILRSALTAVDEQTKSSA